MAFTVCAKPSTLTLSKLDVLQFSFDGGITNELVTVQEVEHAYNLCADLISEFQDWDAGRFTVSRTEYRQLPAVFVQAKRLYDRSKTTGEK
jgi:hypothetical protein